ncbi:hypothetical protein GCM10025774_01680 [Microbacterium kyungheense]
MGDESHVRHSDDRTVRLPETGDLDRGAHRSTPAPATGRVPVTEEAPAVERSGPPSPVHSS